MLVQFSRMKNHETSFQNNIFILILYEKGDSNICISSDVSKNSIISNQDISIIPGHYIYTRIAIEALTGKEYHDTDGWRLPCGILSYKISLKVRTRKKTKTLERQKKRLDWSYF